MRSTSNLAIWSGLICLAFLSAIPSILTWQAQNTLEPYGADDKVDFVVQNALNDMKVVRIVGAINSLLVIFGGVLIKFRRKAGYYLLVGLSGISVAEAIYAVWAAQTIPGRVIIQLFLWGFMLAFVIRNNHRHGATWWRDNVKQSI